VHVHCPLRLLRVLFLKLSGLRSHRPPERTLHALIHPHPFTPIAESLGAHLGSFDVEIFWSRNSRQRTPTILPGYPPRRRTLQRCSITLTRCAVEAVVAELLVSIMACHPIGSVDAELILLDACVIKKALEEPHAAKALQSRRRAAVNTADISSTSRTRWQMLENPFFPRLPMAVIRCRSGHGFLRRMYTDVHGCTQTYIARRSEGIQYGAMMYMRVRTDVARTGRSPGNEPNVPRPEERTPSRHRGAMYMRPRDDFGSDDSHTGDQRA
jgi:hypothetical protein